ARRHAGKRPCRPGAARARDAGALSVDRGRLTELLVAVQRGECGVDDALERLRGMPYEDLDFAKLDHHRALRNGFPEAILGEGKTAEQVVAIAERMAAAGGNVLVTRLDPETG